MSTGWICNDVRNAIDEGGGGIFVRAFHRCFSASIFRILFVVIRTPSLRISHLHTASTLILSLFYRPSSCIHGVVRGNSLRAWVAMLLDFYNYTTFRLFFSFPIVF